MSEYLAVRKVPVTACVATEYGETLLTETEYLKVHAGRMDEAAMGQFFEEQKTELVVDATHPYAAVVSENVAAACKKAGVEYLRLIREFSTSETEDAVLVDSVDIRSTKQISSPLMHPTTIFVFPISTGDHREQGAF